MSIEGQGHFFTIFFQVLYVLCFTRPRYQVSVYMTIGPLVYLLRITARHIYRLMASTDFQVPISIVWYVHYRWHKLDYTGPSMCSLNYCFQTVVGETCKLFSLRSRRFNWASIGCFCMAHTDMLSFVSFQIRTGYILLEKTTTTKNKQTTKYQNI